MGRTPVSAIAQYAPCTIYVRGQVTFSRIASHVDGQELAKQNQEAAAKGRMPHAKPYTSITIKNPVVLDNGKLPAQVIQVIQERFYTKQDGTLMFSQESKSPFLPTVVYSSLAGELAGQGIADKNVPLPAELAVGLDVTIGVSLFSKNGFAGLGMNYILVNEPVRYYSNSALAADFAEAGITYVPPVQQSSPVVEAVVNTSQPTFDAPPQFTQAQATMSPNVTAYNQQVAPQSVASAPWETDVPFGTQPNADMAPQYIQTPATAQTTPQANPAQRPNRYY